MLRAKLCCSATEYELSSWIFINANGMCQILLKIWQLAMRITFVSGAYLLT